MLFSTPPAMRIPPHCPRFRGATLVEVTIAIGIFAFAFLAIWGVLSVGASASRHSKDLAFVAQIQQRLLAAAAEKNGDLATLSNSISFFDGEGLDLSGSATNSWAYRAQVSSGSAVIPGAAANTNLSLITVEVRTRSGESKFARQLWVGTNS